MMKTVEELARLFATGLRERAQRSAETVVLLEAAGLHNAAKTESDFETSYLAGARWMDRILREGEELTYYVEYAVDNGYDYPEPWGNRKPEPSEIPEGYKLVVRTKAIGKWRDIDE